MRPVFHCVLGNRDTLSVYTPTGYEIKPVWNYIGSGEYTHWLTSLVYLEGSVRGPGRYILDCGAWTHRKLDLLPWSTEEVVDAYLGFAKHGDTLTSPDYLVLPGISVEEEHRRNALTLENAKNFYVHCPPGYFPMAVVHGSTLETRLENLKNLLDIGYTRIAIGSVAPRSRDRDYIRSVLDAVSRVRDKIPFYLHVFGVSSLSWIPEFTAYGVDSYDGSTMITSALIGGSFYKHEGLGELKVYRIERYEISLIPECFCNICSILLEQGVDTRTYGTNESNLGRAVHNVNQYLDALHALPLGGV